MAKAKPIAKSTEGLWGKTPASRQRRQEIIAAAKAVFFEDGYQLASMDRIASVAGTTKRTLYDHFGNKDALFAATTEYACQLFVEKLPRSEDLPSDIAVALSFFIKRMSALINTPDTVRFLRMVIAEAERHPTFGRILTEMAFGAAEHVLQNYLEHQIKGGKLRPHAVAPWTRIFIGFATNFEHLQTLLGVGHSGSKGPGENARAQIITMYVHAHRIET